MAPAHQERPDGAVREDHQQRALRQILARADLVPGAPQPASRVPCSRADMPPRSQTRLLKSRLVTIAAIRGHCPAGGCVLALCCDARICTPETRIGLNEVELGIPVPLYWARLMAQITGQGVADKLLQTAALVPALEAVKVGLVDACVPKTELVAVAHAVRTYPMDGVPLRVPLFLRSLV